MLHCDEQVSTSSAMDFRDLNQHYNNKYEEIAIIGTGAYGTVYKARDTQKDGEIVALKQIRVQTSEEGMPISMMREIAVLRQLENFQHPNIVKFLDICPGRKNQNETKLFLVFEHIDQDLAQYLEKCPPPGLAADRIKDLTRQMLMGIDFLHEHRIVHRDLKPQNILVSRTGQVKLADFGLARIYRFDMALTSVVVTLWYRAPEVILTSQYATPIDLWSCGCIFAELHTRKALFPGSNDIDQLNKIFSVIGLPADEDWPDQISLPLSSFRSITRQPFKGLNDLLSTAEPDAIELMKGLLQFKPGDRPTAAEALRDSYFTSNEEDILHVDEDLDDPLSSQSGTSPSSEETSATLCQQASSELPNPFSSTDCPNPFATPTSFPSPSEGQSSSNRSPGTNGTVS